MENPTENLVRSVASVIRGKEEVIRLAVACLVAGGHLLLEDVPGVGKTTLAAALARASGGSFRRIQFTSDLLPADILGTQVYNRKTGEFEFRAGPIFANIVLADEINRSNPKTQSALLEAMNEGRVSMDGSTWDLPEPFMLIATQNPVEHHGTFPLPESQLDRFTMSLSLGYPAFDVERRILEAGPGARAVDRLEPVLDPERIGTLRRRAEAVRVDPEISRYLLRLVRATRERGEVRLGVSTRGAMFLLQAARAAAVLEDRDYLVPDDVKAVAEPVLAHRILLRNGTDRRGARRLVRRILEETEVPV